MTGERWRLGGVIEARLFEATPRFANIHEDLLCGDL
jgi:hypothetical protein